MGGITARSMLWAKRLLVVGALCLGLAFALNGCSQAPSQNAPESADGAAQTDQAFLYADQTLVINDGRVHAFGSPKDVITKELVSTIYDVDVEVNSLYGDKVRVCVPVREIER